MSKSVNESRWYFTPVILIILLLQCSCFWRATAFLGVPTTTTTTTTVKANFVQQLVKTRTTTSSKTRQQRQKQRKQQQLSFGRIKSSSLFSDTQISEFDVATLSPEVSFLLQEKGSKVIELQVFPHRPLGCTVDESLASLAKDASSSSSSTVAAEVSPKMTTTTTTQNYVFVSKVVDGGNADQAGLQVGDVIVGLSGIFEGELMDVTLDGVEKIKGLVGCRLDDEPLHIRVVRGTSVQAKHEEALVDLCSNPGASDREVDECLLQFLTDGYDTSFVSLSDDSELLELVEDDDEDEMDTECLIGGLCNMWAEDLPGNGASNATPQQTNDDKAAETKVKPWSSRSSPSGTWVRDPRTGVMKNLDA